MPLRLLRVIVHILVKLNRIMRKTNNVVFGHIHATSKHNVQKWAAIYQVEIKEFCLWFVGSGLKSCSSVTSKSPSVIQSCLKTQPREVGLNS